MEYTLTGSNFEDIVLTSEEPILVDFWASWCGPCMMLAPFVEELSKTHKVGKVNVDEEPDLANKFRVASIPMLVLVKDGKIAKQTVGYMTKAKLEAWLDK